MDTRAKQRGSSSTMLDPAILGPAVGQSILKLDPRAMIRNPVMFVVEIVAVLTTIIFVRDLISHGPYLGFTFQIIVWLWLTVIFANFAEAVAEGRGKAQAATLRRARTEMMAKRLTNGGAVQSVPAAQLKQGDIVLVEMGDLIPSDGEVVEGIASVDESAITGESAPVIRESGGDRSAVTGGTRVLSDHIKVRITAAQGSTFLDRMIALVEGAERQKTPNEIALNILLAGLTIIFVFAVATIPSFATYAGGAVSVVILVALFVALIPTTIGALLSAIGIAGMDRLVRFNVLAMSGRAVEAAGDVDTPAARQDRHDHARQPPGHRVRANFGRHRSGTGGRRAACLIIRRDAGRPLHRRAGKGEVQHTRPRDGADVGDVYPVLGPHAAVRRRCRRLVDPQGRGRCGAGILPPVERWPDRRRRRHRNPGRAPGNLGSGRARTHGEIRRDRTRRLDPARRAHAKDGNLLGVIHLKDIVKGGIRERFQELRRMGIRTVMITGDNPLTAAAIAAESGVDDFLAQATPEAKLKLIRDEQAQGKLVAMCGDGTNDAPALAQADVGVAMNTGTMAAREAGNMVDLDSDPTKLIEIVEIGKQLLMTRGALTTFSIANDVAKYFAMIPAMFIAFYPQLEALNVMHLGNPRSAILSAIIFNALIIVVLIPLALRGVAYRPIGAAAILRRNLLLYGVGGIIVPFIGIKLIDMLVTSIGLA